MLCEQQAASREVHRCGHTSLTRNAERPSLVFEQPAAPDRRDEPGPVD